MGEMTSKIERAAALLRQGRLVAFPTETVYGLGANALDPVAVGHIFEAKGRPLTSPLIVHVASIDEARDLAAVWPGKAEKLARKFWPGPLTIVVSKTSRVPDVVTGGLDSVGLRVPAHPVALQLLRTVGLPLAAPSANRFMQLSPVTADHVVRGLGDLVPMVLDGGTCEVGIESTVLSLVRTIPKILRPGMVSRAEIEAVIGPVEVGEGAEAPGQHQKHYSPKTCLVLGEKPASGKGFELTLERMPQDAKAYAARLYAALHEIDAMGVEWIWAEMPPDEPEWAGVRDRLMRAAG